jgi:hypothetical protein
MILGSKTLLLPSIVLLIGTVFGASATNAFADDPFKNIANDPFKNIANDPFKNIGEIHDHSFPVGFVDKIKVISYSH